MRNRMDSDDSENGEEAAARDGSQETDENISYYDMEAPGELIINLRTKLFNSLIMTRSCEVSTGSNFLVTSDATNTTTALPQYEVKPDKRGGGFKLIFQHDDKESTIKSSKYSTGKGDRTMRIPENWVHDFTYQFMEAETDKSLSALFPPMNDGDDNRTPDMIKRVGDDKIIVIEFATRETKNFKALNSGCQEKYNKYLMMLKSRKEEYNRINGTNTEVYFGVICSGPTCVSSNFQLPQDVVDQICYRQRIAYSVEPSLEPYGVIGRKELEMSVLEKRCAIELSNIKVQNNMMDDSDQFPELTEDIKKAVWDSETNKALVTKQLETISAQVTKSTLDDFESNVLMIKRDRIKELLQRTRMKYRCLKNGGFHQCCELICNHDISKAGGKKPEKRDEATQSTNSQSPYNEEDDFILRYCLCTDDKKKMSEENKCLSCEGWDELTVEKQKASATLDLLAIQNLIEKEMITIQKALLEDLVSQQQKLKADQSKGDRKRDNKSIIQFPYIPMDTNGSHMLSELDELLTELVTSTEEITTEFNVWQQALANYKETKDDDVPSFSCPFAEGCCTACDPGTMNDDGWDESGGAESFSSECPDLVDSIYDGGVNKGANERSLYGRVKLSELSDQDKLKLALQGVDGKKYADHPAKIIKDHESRKPYHCDTNTNDIDELIMKKWPLLAESCEYSADPVELATDRLLEDAASHLNDSNSLGDIMSSFMEIRKMSMVRAARLISDIAMELNMSMKQHCKKDQFILKRLAGSKVYLIIRPTNSSGSVFYSILWDQQENMSPNDFKGVFKTPIRLSENLYCTEFSSTDKSKLTNQITVWNKLQTVIWFYMNENQLNPSSYGHELPTLSNEEVEELLTGSHIYRTKSSPLTLDKMRKVIKSSILMMIIILHDKSEVEEHLTIMRYICMEGFVALPRIMDPAKMIQKFSLAPRSRLTLWVQKKLLLLMKSLIAGGGYSGEFERVVGSKRKKYKRSNMMNHFTNEEVQSEGELINMFYLGYGVNKSQRPGANILGKLYEKILTWEDKFKDSQIGKIGIDEHEDPESYEDHEYSNEWIKKISDHGLQLIQGLHSSEPKAFLEKTFLQSYAREPIIEVLTTLKASTDFCMGNREPGSGKVHRTKVIEAAKEYIIGDKTYMFELVGEALQKLHNDEGIYIDLFKKNQHGGLREIYIMNINTRIVQHCIESMAKSICGIFESETMTNPVSKNKLFTSHKQKVKNRFAGMDSMTHCSSDDAKKWSQGHYAVKFSLMMCRLMPEKYHHLIRSICVLWLKKRILIDEDLLRIFKKNPGLELGVPVIDKMAKIYTSRQEGCRWMDSGARHICTRTGMMQGILHYTSSLLHTLHNEFLRSYMTDLIRTSILAQADTLVPTISNEMEADKDRYCTPVITVMQSSDDSGIIITLPCPDKNSYLQMSAIMNSCFEIKHRAGRLAGIYPSEKCTSNTPGMIEFNSNWMFMNNKYNPYFKQVLACTTVSGQHTLVARQQETYNYVTNIIEFGGSMLLAFMCMLCIGQQHYQMLGSTMTHLFNTHYAPKLIKLKLPSLGYFLMDNLFLAGLGGWDFIHWVLCKKTDVGMYYYLLFEANRLDEKLESEELKVKALRLDIATSGLFSAVTSLKFGANYKLMRLKDSFPIPTDWLERLNKDPRPILFNPKTPEEKVLKIAAKLHGPGIHSSFNDIDCTSSVASAAGYHLKHACYYVDSAVTNDDLTPTLLSVLTDQTPWNAEGMTDEEKREKLNEIMRARARSLNKKSLMAVLKDAVDTQKNMISQLDDAGFTPTQGKEEYIKSIFPRESDYLTIEFHAESMPRLNLFRDDKNLLNKLSVVKVTTKDFQQYKAPYDLCLQKWFEVGKMDKRTHRYLWTSLQLRFSWIKESYEQTLRASPFTDSIQLFNFLSRLDKSERRVNLLSIPITSTLSESDLTILMNHNLWQGFSTVNPRENEGYKKLSSDSISMRNLAHNLYMVNLFPLTEDYKSTLITDLMSRVNLHKLNIKSQRLQRLSAIVSFVKGAKEEEILNAVKDGNFGVLGSYTRPQTYNKTKKIYEGLGIWEGCVSQLKVKIIISSIKDEGNHLVKVVVSGTADPKQLSEFLKEWCNDNHVLNSRPWTQMELARIRRTLVLFKPTQRSADARRTVSSENIAFCMNNFSPMIPEKGIESNCNIYVDTRYASVPSFLETGSLDLDFSNNTLRLIHISKRNTVSLRRVNKGLKDKILKEKKEQCYTIVSHKISFRDYSQRFVNSANCGFGEETPNKNLVVSWMACEPYKTSDMINLLDEVISKDERISRAINLNEFKTLINVSFLEWLESNTSMKRPQISMDYGINPSSEVISSGIEVPSQLSLIAYTRIEEERTGYQDIVAEMENPNLIDQDIMEAEDQYIMPDCLFGDFISPDINEFEIKSSSRLFNELFFYLFKTDSDDGELKLIVNEGELPLRCKSDIKYYEYILGRTMKINADHLDRSKPAFDKHFKGLPKPQSQDSDDD
nr:hypothetical protein [Nelson Bunya-like virus 1]